MLGPKLKLSMNNPGSRTRSWCRTSELSNMPSLEHSLHRHLEISGPNAICTGSYSRIQIHNSNRSRAINMWATQPAWIRASNSNRRTKNLDRAWKSKCNHRKGVCETQLLHAKSKITKPMQSRELTDSKFRHRQVLIFFPFAFNLAYALASFIYTCVAILNFLHPSFSFSVIFVFFSSLWDRCVWLRVAVKRRNVNWENMRIWECWFATDNCASDWMDSRLKEFERIWFFCAKKWAFSNLQSESFIGEGRELTSVNSVNFI